MWSANQKPVRCPVCGALLGRRDIEVIYRAHCEECKTTFWWRPHSIKPSAVLDKDIPAKCGCGRCGR